MVVGGGRIRRRIPPPPHVGTGRRAAAGRGSEGARRDAAGGRGPGARHHGRGQLAGGEQLNGDEPLAQFLLRLGTERQRTLFRADDDERVREAARLGVLLHVRDERQADDVGGGGARRPVRLVGVDLQRRRIVLIERLA